MLGSIISAGLIFVITSIANLITLMFPENIILKTISDMIWLIDSKQSFFYALIWIAMFSILSLRRIDKIEIANHGS
ncbi:hypothetical protein [Thermosipho globiformans]|uniref:hypothetical protein n=1 Tax=Thermosipho globiformans TaxID=380685 RepID=UPI000F8EDEB9|nr:hypothetical protein [Thermosipho globiformans]